MRPSGATRQFRFATRTDDDIRTDVTDEQQFHLEMRSEELRRGGMAEPEARAQALREFGSTTTSATRLARTGALIERQRRFSRYLAEFWRDALLGVRLLWRSPGFAAAAIVTLALGIGANTAIYSVLDAVLLRPLPLPDPERLVMISETREDGGANSVSGGAFLDWRDHQRQFEGITLTGRVAFNLQGRSAPERLRGLEVSHDFLRTLGVPARLGRGFLPEEERSGGPTDVVMLTEELWRSHFAADPGIVGTRIVLDSVPRTIVGVLPAGAWIVRDDMFFVPAVLAPETSRASRAGHWAAVFGRLAPGATVASAHAELTQIKKRLNAEYPIDKQQWGVLVQPVTAVLGGVTRTPLLMLLGAVAMVLLIACANVANLVLARGCHREQEMATRAAIGAGAARLVRQMLTESLALALIGGVAGVLVAALGLRVLRQLLSTDAVPFTFSPDLNLQVLLFTVLVTMITGVLFGVLPALRSRRPDLSLAINSGGRRTTGAGRQRTQSLLVVAQVAFTVVLLACTGLLLRSLTNASRAEPGFDPDRVLSFDVSLPEATYESRDARLAFAGALLDRLRALPGVEAAGTGMAIPFVGGGYGEYFGRGGGGDQDRVLGRVDYVSPGYLETLGARLRAGRLLTADDNRGAGSRVAVISETTARRFYAGGDAIGQMIRISPNEYRVVGVVGDIVDRRVDVTHGPFGYVPHAFNFSQISVAVRTTRPPLTMVHAVRQALQQVDGTVALANPRALDQAMASSLLQRRVILGLVATFAAVALLLACVGIYGVMAYAVASRRREFGVRMALGAASAHVVRQVLAGGMRLMAVGLAIGVIGAAAAARLIASELYQVRQYDPMVLGATATAIATVALLACWIPAWRALRFGPAAALRAE